MDVSTFYLGVVGGVVGASGVVGEVPPFSSDELYIWNIILNFVRWQPQLQTFQKYLF